jgi:hypothetical protein
MVIMGIDPSYNALSMSIYNVETGKVYVHTLSTELGDSIGFEKIFEAARYLREEQKKYIDSLIEEGCIDGITEIFSETPPPTAMFSSGLYALDVLMLSSLFDTYNTIERIYSIPSSYVSVIHGTNKYNKSQSTQLAKYFIDEILNNDIEVIIPDSISKTGRKLKGRMNNDKAESFLFLLRAITKYDINGLALKVSQEMSGFMHESEKLLIERS